MEVPKGNNILKFPTFRKVIKRRVVTYNVGGGKTISTKAALVYLFSNIFGEPIVSIPCLMCAVGVLPSLVMNTFICITAIIAALMIMRAMTMIEGNQNFEKRFEYVPIVQFYLGDRIALCMEIGFHALQWLNFLSINAIAETIDLVFIRLFKHSYGVQVYPYISLRTFTEDNIQDRFTDPSTETVALVLTCGYLFIALVCIPISRYNLDDSIFMQYVTFPLVIITVITLTGTSLHRIIFNTHTFAPDSDSSMLLKMSLDQLQCGYNKFNITDIFQSSFNSNLSFEGDFIGADVYTHSNTTTPNVQYPPLVGSFNLHDLFSTFIGVYSFVNVIPSWANEVKPDVPIPQTLLFSGTVSMLLYSVFGVLLSYAFPHIQSDNAFQEILLTANISWFVHAAIYSFAFFAVMPGIISNCIATRYNYVNTGTLTEKSAFFVGSVLPFLVSWLFAGDTLFTYIFAWLQLFLSFACNFVAPACVYVIACQTSPLAWRNPTRHQTVRMGIEAFKVSDGSVQDIQAQLRDWAASVMSKDPELQALLNEPEEVSMPMSRSRKGRNSHGSISFEPSKTKHLGLETLGDYQRDRRLSVDSTITSQHRKSSLMSPSNNNLHPLAPTDGIHRRRGSGTSQASSTDGFMGTYLSQRFSVLNIVESHQSVPAAASTPRVGGLRRMESKDDMDLDLARHGSTGSDIFRRKPRNIEELIEMHNAGAFRNDHNLSVSSSIESPRSMEMVEEGSEELNINDDYQDSDEDNSNIYNHVKFKDEAKPNPMLRLTDVLSRDEISNNSDADVADESILTLGNGDDKNNTNDENTLNDREDRDVPSSHGSNRVKWSDEAKHVKSPKIQRIERMSSLERHKFTSDITTKDDGSQEEEINPILKTRSDSSIMVNGLNRQRYFSENTKGRTKSSGPHVLPTLEERPFSYKDSEDGSEKGETMDVEHTRIDEDDENAEDEGNDDEYVEKLDRELESNTSFNAQRLSQLDITDVLKQYRSQAFLTNSCQSMPIIDSSKESLLDDKEVPSYSSSLEADQLNTLATRFDVTALLQQYKSKRYEPQDSLNTPSDHDIDGLSSNPIVKSIQIAEEAPISETISKPSSRVSFAVDSLEDVREYDNTEIEPEKSLTKPKAVEEETADISSAEIVKRESITSVDGNEPSPFGRRSNRKLGRTIKYGGLTRQQTQDFLKSFDSNADESPVTPNHEMPTIATVTVTSASPVAADAHNENTAAPVRRQQRKKTTFKVEKPSMQALLSPSIVRTRSFSDEDLAIHTPIPSVHVAKADSLEDVVNPPLTHKSSINSKRGSAIGQQEEKYERLNQVKRTLALLENVKPKEGLEDVYACDEDPETGRLKPIRIHVFPEGVLRRHHLVTTYVLMGSLTAVCVLSVILDLWDKLFA